MYRYAETPGNGPLVFTFHGTGGSEDQFHGFAQELIPDAHVVSPRGDVSEQGALRFFRRTGEGVYDMADLAKRRTAMAAFMAGFGTGATALGYSNGANILAAVMLEQPVVVDRVVLLHPLIPWTPAPQPELQGKQVLITAGERDPICPPAQTKAFGDYLLAQGAEVTLYWHAGGHEIDHSEISAIARHLTG